MNKTALARNLLITRQLQEIAAALGTMGIEAVVLKGAALIHLVPAYSVERIMEDIDLLVRPADLAAVRRLLLSRGYAPCSEDPGSLRNPQHIAPIDLSDRLWYHDRHRNEALWSDGMLVPLNGFPGMYRLPLDEMYVHIFAHGAVHHAGNEAVWLRDLEMLRTIAGNDGYHDAVERKLRAYGFIDVAGYYEGKSGRWTPALWLYRWLVKKQHPDAGHIARFIFLPLRSKTALIARSLFPSSEFLRARYNLTSRVAVIAYRILRPVLLLRKICLLAVSSFPVHP